MRASNDYVQLFWDGRKVCAEVGHDPRDTMAGFGPTVAEALRDLADRIELAGYLTAIDKPRSIMDLRHLKFFRD